MREKHRNLKRNKIVSAFSILLVVFMTFIFYVFPSSAISLNRFVSADRVKVFVGSSRATSIVKANAYMKERARFLNELADSDPDTVFSAVVVFNDYYSVQDIEEFAEHEIINVEQIYLWAPGETGRTSLSVKENNIQGAITRYYNRAKGLEGTAEFGAAEADYIRMIDENYGIFSATVNASAEVLKAMTYSEIVEFVDVKYSEEAEKIAAESGVDVYYIELPYKPDGAL